MVKPFVVQQEENPDMEDDMRKDDIWIRLWKLMKVNYRQKHQENRVVHLNLQIYILENVNVKKM